MEAMAGNFFQLLKREKAGIRASPIRDAARRDVFGGIEGGIEFFCNPTRKIATTA